MKLAEKSELKEPEVRGIKKSDFVVDINGFYSMLLDLTCNYHPEISERSMGSPNERAFDLKLDQWVEKLAKIFNERNEDAQISDDEMKKILEIHGRTTSYSPFMRLKELKLARRFFASGGSYSYDGFSFGSEYSEGRSPRCFKRILGVEFLEDISPAIQKRLEILFDLLKYHQDKENNLNPWHDDNLSYGGTCQLGSEQFKKFGRQVFDLRLHTLTGYSNPRFVAGRHLLGRSYKSISQDEEARAKAMQNASNTAEACYIVRSWTMPKVFMKK